MQNKFRLFMKGKFVGYQKDILTSGVIGIYHSKDGVRQWMSIIFNIHNYIPHDVKDAFTGRMAGDVEIYERDIVQYKGIEYAVGEISFRGCFVFARNATAYDKPLAELPDSLKVIGREGEE